NGKHSFDIHLEAYLKPADGSDNLLTKSNFRYMYWTMSQQLTHHTSNGCPVTSGDMMGSGTISGPSPDSYGSLLELTWKGERPLALTDGTSRTFVEDGDTVTLRGYCEKDHVRIGFGECSGKILPSL
ncbi:MAG: fumarylacetoacetate hydrolase family protein, partial [Flavobacteriaceae bacterium]|nr:fumarylacetoacetate hydrolase family protein [Flavobacteriaceae bacterium]